MRFGLQLTVVAILGTSIASIPITFSGSRDILVIAKGDRLFGVEERACEPTKIWQKERTTYAMLQPK